MSAGTNKKSKILKRSEEDKAMTLLTFGKHKNEMLEMTPDTYIKWLAAHKNVLSVEHRHISDIAKAILANREQVAAHAEAVERFESEREARLAVKAAQQIISTPVKVDLGLKGNLNTSRGFQLMR
jgi:hypothetical protein